MYFSRVWLDPTRRGTRRLLASPQRVHAVVAGAINSGGPAGRPLWRLDSDSTGTQLLAVSERQPDFTSLLEQCQMPVEDGWQTTEYDPFLTRLSEGQLWRFRLAANPVRSLRETSDPTSLTRGKRVPITGVRGQEQWLRDRAAALGVAFDGDAFIVSGHRAEGFRRRSTEIDDARISHRVTISTVRFDGTLTVADPEALRSALTTGIGSAKAYGCGLLTLAPT